MKQKIVFYMSKEDIPQHDRGVRVGFLEGNPQESSRILGLFERHALDVMYVQGSRVTGWWTSVPAVVEFLPTSIMFQGAPVKWKPEVMDQGFARVRITA